MKEKEYEDENGEVVKTPVRKNEEDNKILIIQEFIKNKGKKTLWIALAVIAVIGAAILIKVKIDNDAEENNQAASLALSRILPYINSGDYEKALNGDATKLVRGEKIIGLVEIIKKYEGTPSADIASFYAGKCYESTEKYTEAEKYFEKALGSESDLVLMGANAGMGICMEKKNDYQSAVKYYEEAASKSIAPDTKNRYQYYAALCLEEIKDFEKAAKLYNEIIAENKSQFVGYSKAGLTRMGKAIE